jgi:hypothetical protein
MTKATSWQPHSVRGFLAGVVRKRLKLRLAKKIAGARVYQITRAADGARQSRRRSGARRAGVILIDIEQRVGCDVRMFGCVRSSSRDIFKNIHRNSKGLMNYYNSYPMPRPVSMRTP